MHELSIAQNIVEIVSKSAQKEGAKGIVEINLKVGKIAGVEIEALKFSLEIAGKDSLIENAKINILNIEGKANCKDCKSSFVIKDLFTPCPACGNYNSEIIEGKELQIVSFDII